MPQGCTTLLRHRVMECGACSAELQHDAAATVQQLLRRAQEPVSISAAHAPALLQRAIAELQLAQEALTTDAHDDNDGSCAAEDAVRRLRAGHLQPRDGDSAAMCALRSGWTVHAPACCSAVSHRAFARAYLHICLAHLLHISSAPNSCVHVPADAYCKLDLARAHTCTRTCSCANGTLLLLTRVVSATTRGVWQSCCSSMCNAAQAAAGD